LRTRRALGWTQRKLRPEDSSFLAGLPAELQFSDALCLHATLDDPTVELIEPWQFYEESRVIRRRYPDVRICFTGHTHHQQIVEITGQGEAFVRGARHHVLRSESFFFVNPGSVGSPADGDYRAAYAVYDDSVRKISFRRTTYDRLRVMQENIRHGLTSRLGVSPVDYLWNRATTAARSLKSRILTGIP
jgi:diadenosine tetraphosphatase ApaH/serine/threonine PP2A family protein phosphatase